MQRPVSSLPLSQAVRLKLGSAGFQLTADLLDFKPDKLSKGTAPFPPTVPKNSGQNVSHFSSSVF